MIVLEIGLSLFRCWVNQYRIDDGTSEARPPFCSLNQHPSHQHQSCKLQFLPFAESNRSASQGAFGLIFAVFQKGGLHDISHSSFMEASFPESPSKVLLIPTHELQQQQPRQQEEEEEGIVYWASEF